MNRRDSMKTVLGALTLLPTTNLLTQERVNDIITIEDQPPTTLEWDYNYYYWSTYAPVFEGKTYDVVEFHNNLIKNINIHAEKLQDKDFKWCTARLIRDHPDLFEDLTQGVFAIRKEIVHTGVDVLDIYPFRRYYKHQRLEIELAHEEYISRFKRSEG